MTRRKKPREILVECANCKHPLEVGDHRMEPFAGTPTEKVHVVESTKGFIGTVGCPVCGHFTSYERQR